MPETGNPATHLASPAGSPESHVPHALQFIYQCHMLESVVVVFTMPRRSFLKNFGNVENSLHQILSVVDPLLCWKDNTIATRHPWHHRVFEDKRWRGKRKTTSSFFFSGSQLRAMTRAPPRARLSRSPLLFLGLRFSDSSKRRCHPFLFFAAQPLSHSRKKEKIVNPV